MGMISFEDWSVDEISLGNSINLFNGNCLISSNNVYYGGIKTHFF